MFHDTVRATAGVNVGIFFAASNIIFTSSGAIWKTVVFNPFFYLTHEKSFSQGFDFKTRNHRNY
jgi:hypothetical protein